MHADPDALREEARALAAGAPLPAIPGAPAAELRRSPAAARVARAAARDGLFLFHYEHVAHRALLDAWVPEAEPALGDPPRWADGVLPERKYQGFRHDQAPGGFHPGQRAKWTAHELAHGLVGFGWRADATPFWLALAGRLGEAVPVALWYFLDEAFLRRCPDHADAGALFGAGCAACERAAGPDPDDPHAAARLADGARFLDGELAAVARSRRLGRPVPHRWATLDLATDGIAYAAAHGPRLRSAPFQRWVEAFAVRDGGWSEELDRLEARVDALGRHLLGGPPPAPLAPDPEAGRARWVAQDLGWRLLTVAEETEGAAATGLLELVDRLAALTAPEPPALDATLRAVIAGYRALAAEWVLPPAAEAFAVGHPLPDGLGSHVPGLLRGVRSATPLTARALGRPLRRHVAAFAGADLAHPDRALLADRWADWLGRAPGVSPAVRDLARYEAALRDPTPGDGVAGALGPGDGPVRLAPGARALHPTVDVVELADRLTDGAPAAAPALAAEAPARPTRLVVVPAGSERLVVEVDEATARALEGLGEGGDWPLDRREAARLTGLGVLVPARWAERRTTPARAGYRHR